MASLFTSLYPHNIKAFYWKRIAIPDQALTLAEKLKQNGYYTFALQTNPTIKGIGFQQGFDLYYYKSHLQDKAIIDMFIEKAEQIKNKKFFAYMHFMNNHLPYKSSKKYVSKWEPDYQGDMKKYKITMGDILDAANRGRTKDLEYDSNDLRFGTAQIPLAVKRHVTAVYDAATSSFDDQFQRLLDYLDQEGLLDKTIIILTADHGEELWDHNGFEHGHSMYNELLHVPLIMLHPKIRGQEIRIKQIIRLIDIFPTLMSFLGLSVPEHIFGKDMTAILSPGSRMLNIYAFSEGTSHGPRLKALQSASYKVIMDPRISGLSFYALDKNFKETKPLNENVHFDLFVQKMDEYIAKDVDFEIESEEANLDQQSIEEIRSLGYLQ